MCLARISVPEGRWLIGNVDYMGFYRTNYDISMWKRIIDQLHTDHTVRTHVSLVRYNAYDDDLSLILASLAITFN